MDLQHRVRALLPKLVTLLVTEISDTSKEFYSAFQILSKLASDHQKTVRGATIAGFAIFSSITTLPDILEKIKSNITKLLENANRKTQREFVRVFGPVMPGIIPSLRDTCIIPEIAKITDLYGKLKKLGKKKRILVYLLPAYRELAGCNLSTEIKNKYIIPGIEIIQRDQQLLDNSERRLLNEVFTELRQIKAPVPLNLRHSSQSGDVNHFRSMFVNSLKDFGGMFDWKDTSPDTKEQLTRSVLKCVLLK